MNLRRIPFWTWLVALALLSFAACSQRSTGSPALDAVLQADYGKWEQMIGADPGLYIRELQKLNPHYDLGSRESITSQLQKIILPLFAIQKKGGAVVELGAWTGGGALLMAPFLTRDRSYHAVDTFDAENMPDEYIQKYLRGRKHLDVFKGNITLIRNKVVIHQGLTNDVAKTWPKDLKIDLLFIDADHSYKGVSSDWKNWSPFMRRGGIIAFHDYYTDVSLGHPGVRKFIEESIIPLARKNFHSISGLAWYVVQ